MTDNKFEVEEKEVTKLRKTIKFKYKNDEDEFKNFSDKQKSIFYTFVIRNIMKDGEGGKFYISKRQRIVVEEILKDLYINGNQLLSKLKENVIKNVDKRCRDLGLKYENKMTKILESVDKNILVRKSFGNKNFKFFDGKNTIDKSLSIMRPHLITIWQKRSFDKGKYFRYTAIKTTVLGLFLGRLLAKEELKIEENIVNVKVENEKNKTN